MGKEKEEIKEYTFYSASTYDAETKISLAEEAISIMNVRKAIELCIEAAADVFSQLLQKVNVNPSLMNISDMAYILERKGFKIKVTDPAYKLNTMRLKLLANISISPSDAKEAIKLAKYIIESAKEAPYKVK